LQWAQPGAWAVLCSIFVAAPAMADLAVHVNRVALEADGPKSALVESDKAGATGEFTVLRDGKTVLVAPLVAQPDLRSGAPRSTTIWPISRS